MTTTVPPSWWTPMQKRSGAAWYSGAGDRYTSPGPKPRTSRSTGVMMIGDSSSGRCAAFGRMPFGRPVVPDE
jgi:hypothetical protein